MTLRDRYDVIRVIGAGAHGTVYEAYVKDDQSNNQSNNQTNNQSINHRRKVALKEIYAPLSSNHSINEIDCLMECQNSPHVMKCYAVHRMSDNIVLELEWFPTDLAQLLKMLNYQGRSLPHSAIKHILRQLVAGIQSINESDFVHRDIKPSNCLLDRSGRLVIGDFGECGKIDRSINQPINQKNNKKTNKRSGKFNQRSDQSNNQSNDQPNNQPQPAGTRWYRAPELLFGSRSIDQMIDRWSVGCILSELFINQPVNPGINELDQIRLIVRLIGPPPLTDPTVSQWPDIHKIVFNQSNNQSNNQPNNQSVNEARFQDLFMCDPSDEQSMSLVNLVTQLLQWSPLKRLTPTQALNHSYLVHQLINQSSDQSNNQTTDQTIDQPIDFFDWRYEIDQCEKFRMSLMNQSNNQSNNQSVNQINQKLSDKVNRPFRIEEIIGR